MAILYKICSAPLWRAAEQRGFFDGSPVDRRDGYIHLSTAGQVAETAARHFAGETDVLLVAVDEGRLRELRYELSHRGDLFPHLYSDLPTTAVVWVKPLLLGPDGRHLFPELP